VIDLLPPLALLDADRHAQLSSRLMRTASRLALPIA
jgi:hypothetical protein